MNQGYFFIALGQQYIQECYNLTQTIRKQGDNRPVSLLIHEKDKNIIPNNVFDKLVYFKSDDELFKDCNTSFEKYCLYPRINFEKYIPYDENIIVDSDVLCQYSADKLWEYLSNQSIPIKMTGHQNDPSWHWGKINEVSQKFGKHVPHVHGGFFYIRKSEFANKFFEYTREVFYRYDEYGCKRFFRSGKTDEIIFAIAHSHFDIEPMDFHEVPAMTFNYGKEIAVPSKLQTERVPHEELSDYIPFVHMFDKLGGSNYQSLYERTMK